MGTEDKDLDYRRQLFQSRAKSTTVVGTENLIFHTLHT